jgi:membrane protein implicated in regulation of membrane protease activity
MEQTRLGSLLEAGINIAIGYIVALLSQIAVFPMFGIHVPLGTNLWIGAWFTVISLVRSYVVRRWFDARLRDADEALAAGAQQIGASRRGGRTAFND